MRRLLPCAACAWALGCGAAREPTVVDPTAVAVAHVAPHVDRAPKSVPIAGREALLTRVAALRGLVPIRPVEVHVLAEGPFAERVGRATAGEVSRAAKLVRRAFGIGATSNTRKASAARSRAGRYLGLYDFRAHELLVRDGLGAREEGVVAHELVHALQDQHFGLVGAAAEPDQALAIEALYEGDAVLLRERMAAARAGEDEKTFVKRAVTALEELPALTVARAVGAPEHVLGARAHERDEALFPYLAGLRFAWRIYEAGGNAALDEAYARPPRSTSEVMHPDRYIANASSLPNVAEPSLPVGSERVGAGVLGELRTSLVLARCDRETKDRVRGFVADRFVFAKSTLAKSDTETLMWTTAWSTDEDAEAAVPSLRSAARCWPGAPANVTVIRSAREVTLVRSSR